MVALQALWTLIKNPKNLAIGILGFLAILACAGMVYYKVSKDSLIQQYQKEKIAFQQVQLKMADNNMKAINAMNEAWKKNAKETANLTAKIANINIEGKCIKDESYYDTAKSIADRHNRLF
ncbi:MAG: hypothetical protein WC332_01490 [Clostridia bacterium]|jgi:hypothetical protein